MYYSARKLLSFFKHYIYTSRTSITHRFVLKSATRVKLTEADNTVSYRCIYRKDDTTLPLFKFESSCIDRDTRPVITAFFVWSIFFFLLKFVSIHVFHFAAFSSLVISPFSILFSTDNFKKMAKMTSGHFLFILVPFFLYDACFVCH